MSPTFLALVIASFSSVSRALTHYKIVNVKKGMDMLRCGHMLEDVHIYCAARVNNTSCEPLTVDWCSTKDMTDGATYMIKDTVLDETPMFPSNRQPIPVYMCAGSEIEVKFKVYSYWKRLGVDLKDDLGNIYLHNKLEYPKDFYWNSQINGGWGRREGYIGTFSYTLNSDYTVRIHCRTNDFQIYFNGILRWTFTYRRTVTLISNVDIYSIGGHGDLLSVTYKAAT